MDEIAVTTSESDIPAADGQADDRKLAQRRARYAANPEQIRERSRAYYAANRDKRLLYVRTRYAEHRDRVLEQNRRSHAKNGEKYNEKKRKQRAADPEVARERERIGYAANRDKKRAQARARYAANIDKMRERDRNRRLADPEKFRERDRGRRIKNPETRRSQDKAHTHRRRALKAAAPSTFTAADWRALVARSTCCYWCKRRWTKHRTPTHDHIIPLSKGGDNSVANSVCACSDCNSRKNARLIDPVSGQRLLL